MEERLMEKTIGKLIKGRYVYSVQTGQTVFDVARSMSEKHVGAVAVLENDRLVGIFSERDLMTRVVAKGLNPQKVLVSEVMTRNLISAASDDSYAEAMNIMQKASIRHLLIVDGGELVGMLSLRDLMQVDISEKSAEIESLNEYIHYSPPQVQNLL
jgi:CBS domain-containing protein